MELRQLAYLAAVAEHGSFTRAAASLLVAQPGVSAQVRRLEAELGTELLDRSGASVTPTAAGAAVLPHARAALAAVARVRATVDELAGLVRGRVAFGVLTSTATDVLPDLLAAFHAEHPGVEVALTEAASGELLERVRDGGLDLALAGAPPQPAAGLALELVHAQPVVAAVGPGDPWAGRDDVTLAALAGRPLISLPRGTALRAVLDDALAAARLEAHVAFEASDPFMLCRLAARGLGVGVLPASAVAASPEPLRAVPVTRPSLRARLVLATREGGPQGSAGRAFLSRARAALGVAPA